MAGHPQYTSARKVDKKENKEKEKNKESSQRTYENWCRNVKDEFLSPKNRSGPRLLHDSHHVSCYYDQDSPVADSEPTSIVINADQSSFQLYKTDVLTTTMLAVKHETLSRKTSMFLAVVTGIECQTLATVENDGASGMEQRLIIESDSSSANSVCEPTRLGQDTPCSNTPRHGCINQLRDREGTKSRRHQ